MFGILVSVEVIVSILLIVVVLMQSSKGGGLAGTFGGAQIGTVFGVRRTADFLGKITTILAGIFLVLSLVINFLLPNRMQSSESILQRGVAPRQVPPPQLPAQTSSPAATPQQQR
ncbi:MAG: preprotein translocase subunit SecG [Bacteroidota bacterium]